MDLKQKIFDFYLKEVDKLGIQGQMIYMYEAMENSDEAIKLNLALESKYEILNELVHYFADSVFEEMFEKEIKRMELQKNDSTI